MAQKRVVKSAHSHLTRYGAHERKVHKKDKGSVHKTHATPKRHYTSNSRSK